MKLLTFNKGLNITLKRINDILNVIKLYFNFNSDIFYIRK